jgi:hypothetical protein
MAVLWWLSFCEENHYRMVREFPLMESLLAIWSDENDCCHDSAEGTLFQMKDELKYSPKKKFQEVGKHMVYFTLLGRGFSLVVRVECWYAGNSGSNPRV